MLKLLFLSILLLAVALEVGGDVLFKYWAEGSGRLMLALGLLVYALGSLFWAYSLKFESLSKAGTAFMVLNIVAIAAVGAIVFHEKLTWYNLLGIGFGIAAVVLIEI